MACKQVSYQNGPLNGSKYKYNTKFGSYLKKF